MNTVYLLLGSNLGNSTTFIYKASKLILTNVGTIIKESSNYESPPWGFKNANDFINKVLVVETVLSPNEVLSNILEIEQFLGRKRTHNKNYESRIIDIDILFFNEEIIKQKNLTIPHPRLHERRFTLLPLIELESDFIHPEFRLPISKLLLNCKDCSLVKKI